MLKAAVLLVAVPIALSACGGGGGDPGLRQQLSALSDAQFNQVFTMGLEMCGADASDFSQRASVAQKDGYATDIAKVINSLCPSRSAEYKADQR